MSLLTRIEQYRARTGMPETTFGRKAVNDPRLVRDIRAGRQVGVHLRERVETFLSQAVR